MFPAQEETMNGSPLLGRPPGPRLQHQWSIPARRPLTSDEASALLMPPVVQQAQHQRTVGDTLVTSHSRGAGGSAEGVERSEAFSWPTSVTGNAWSVMPAAPIVETLVPVLLEKPHAVVIQFEDGASLTAEALLARAEQFAAYVSKRVPRGTPIAVAMGNRAEFFIIWLALLGTGHPMVNMNPALTQTEAEHMLRDSRSAWVLAEQQTSQLFRSAQTKCPDLSEVLILGEQEPDGLLAFCDEDDSFDLLSAPPSIHDTTFITYTSGTTGMPKGCAHLQGETCRYVDVVGRLYDLRSTDSFLNPLQFFYGDSIWLFALSLKLGAPFVSMRKFSVNRFWSVVQQFETTVLLGIGAIPNLLLKREPTTDEQNHTMRMALQIGVPPRHHRELVERFGLP